MATISKSDLEVLARQLLRDQIDRPAWHHGLSKKGRTVAIAADVEAWWHLRAGEAAQMLAGRVVAGQKSARMTQDGLSVPSGPPTPPEIEKCRLGPSYEEASERRTRHNPREDRYADERTRCGRG